MSLKKTIHVALALLFLGGLGGGLTACNTIEGIGEDISSTGRYVKDKVFRDEPEIQGGAGSLDE